MARALKLGLETTVLNNVPQAPRPPAVPPVSVIVERLGAIRRRISETGRDPRSVDIVAVTKGFGLLVVEASLAAGIVDIGENYAAELVAKAQALPAGAPAPKWHYLGAIQRRRVRLLAPFVGCWQSVSRIEEGHKIAQFAPGADVFVEVNVAGEPSRNGVRESEAADLVAALVSLGLRVRGLMVVAPRGDQTVVRDAFHKVADLGADLRLQELSMGMSDDLELALAEGSTMVRVGRALFGERPR